MTKLILIRGLPGSGKSTMAKAMLQNLKADFHYEADMWLCRHSICDENGRHTGFSRKRQPYHYTPDRAKDAHAACIHMTRFELSLGNRAVVVSNTFTQRWEMQPYLDAAKETGATVEIITATGNYGSIHNVPESVIQAMRERWEEVTV